MAGGADGDTWTTDDEWYVKVFFDWALFTRLKPVLPDVVAIVCGVEDESVVDYASFLEATDDALYYLIDRLQRTKAAAVEVVVEVEVRLILSRQARDPGDTTGLYMLARHHLVERQQTSLGLKCCDLGTFASRNSCSCRLAAIGGDWVTECSEKLPSMRFSLILTLL